ncbi:AMP-binding domain containing protein [Asbolus verrucosus]|uniref:AMP-binding domain containing protein n=1 Tax=Asbolus verrucosus TaxID=1661398 RepID=A0A482WE60_ASBVE|nr:AMP-binding domain containing protein [Asbolus verrucosus]
MSQKTKIKGPQLKYTIKSSVGEFYFNCADRFSDQICQIDADSDKAESYSSVKKRSTRAALELQRRGITDQDVVVLFTRVTLDYIIPILGCFYLGTKVGTLDTSLSMRQIAQVLHLVAPTMVFVEKDYVVMIEESLRNARVNADIIVFGQSVKYSTLDDFLKPHPKEEKFKPPKVKDGDAESSLSHSSQFSKHCSFSLVSISSKASNSTLRKIYSQAGFTCDCILYSASFSRIVSLILMTCAFLSGGQRVFYSAIEAENILSIIQKYKVTHYYLTPMMSYKLTKFEKFQDYDISSLECVLLSGSPISRGQFETLTHRFKESTVISAYGLKEAGLVTIFDPKKDYKFTTKKVGSSGKLIAGISAKIVDLETHKLLGPNEIGEICIKSPTIMKGYYNADSSTAFDREGYLKTGDVGYFDNDECFFIVDRVNNLFKGSSGHISPTAIETVLLEHLFVKEAAVFGVPVNEEEGEAPAACVVLEKDSTVTEDEIKNFVAERVPDQQQLKGGVKFVDKLPTTPSGKVMREEIKSTFLDSSEVKKV